MCPASPLSGLTYRRTSSVSMHTTTPAKRTCRPGLCCSWDRVRPGSSSSRSCSRRSGDLHLCGLGGPRTAPLSESGHLLLALAAGRGWRSGWRDAPHRGAVARPSPTLGRHPPVVRPRRWPRDGPASDRPRRRGAPRASGGRRGGRLHLGNALRADLVAADRFFEERFKEPIDAFIAAAGVEAPPPEPPRTTDYEPDQIDILDLDAAGISTVIWTSGYRRGLLVDRAAGHRRDGLHATGPRANRCPWALRHRQPLAARPDLGDAGRSPA